MIEKKFYYNLGNQEQEFVNYHDLESIQIYNNSKYFLENFEQNFKDIEKKIKFDCQIAINKSINTISNHIGSRELQEEYLTLKAILLGKSSINFSVHPQCEALCKNILALKILVRFNY